MSRIAIVRRPERKGLYLAKGIGSRSLLFPLGSIERGELDELIRGILAKQGITNETEIQAVIDAAEKDAEMRIKIAEVRAETARLMEIRRKGGKLMSIGFRKWAQAFYPSTNTLTKAAASKVS